MPKSRKNFYAVARGRSGERIYRTWGECAEQVLGYKGARFKGFATREECWEFIRENRFSPIRRPAIKTEAFSEQGKRTNQYFGDVTIDS